MLFLEALACETPVISTEIVGVASDVKKSNSGIIIPPKDVDELADAIITILNNKDKSKKMGNEWKKACGRESYTWSGIAKDDGKCI